MWLHPKISYQGPVYTVLDEFVTVQKVVRLGELCNLDKKIIQNFIQLTSNIRQKRQKRAILDSLTFDFRLTLLLILF